MPQDLGEIDLLPGQTIVVKDSKPLKISTNSTKTRVRVTAQGTYVPPPVTPPTEPPPVEPPPVIPPVVEPPVITPPGVKSVPVSNAVDLLKFLDDDTVDEIVARDGTYHVSAASGQAADSLWIGSKFADRTRPIIVRAQTPGGVTLDGAGASGGLTFNGGAHDQVWNGFKFANFRPEQTGVMVFGGYAGLAAPHHITLRNITMLPSVVGVTDHNDHCIYFSWSVGGAHDILIEDYVASPGLQIQSALQFYHSDANNVCAHHVTVRRMHVTGTQNTILIYDPTVHDVLIEDSDIKGERDVAVNINACGSNVVLRNVTSSKAGSSYYPSGKPAGLTLINCNFP